jgi:hypothetical protein
VLEWGSAPRKPLTPFGVLLQVAEPQALQEFPPRGLLYAALRNDGRAIPGP